MRVRLEEMRAETTTYFAIEGSESGRDILRLPDFKFGNFDTEVAGRGLNLIHFQNRLGMGDICQDC